jgi:hypothetical protein
MFSSNGSSGSVRSGLGNRASRSSPRLFKSCNSCRTARLSAKHWRAASSDILVMLPHGIRDQIGAAAASPLLGGAIVQHPMVPPGAAAVGADKLARTAFYVLKSSIGLPAAGSGNFSVGADESSGGGCSGGCRAGIPGGGSSDSGGAGTSGTSVGGSGRGAGADTSGAVGTAR